MSHIDPRDLHDARAQLLAYQRRFTTQHSDMHRAIGVALRCIDSELARASACRQLTIDDIKSEP